MAGVCNAVFSVWEESTENDGAGGGGGGNERGVGWVAATFDRFTGGSGVQINDVHGGST